VVDSPKDYISTLVDALIMLRSARDRFKTIESAKAPSDVIVIFENAKQEFMCAGSYVLAYNKSPVRAIQTSSRLFGATIERLVQVNESFRQDFKDKLDGKVEKPSEHAERNGMLTVESNDAWHFEMNSVVAAGLSLVEFDEKKQRLILTSSERDLLVQRLEKTFGVVAHQKGDLAGLEDSVSVFLDFLTDEGRKTRD
jgi:hypothetical protein